MEALTDAVARSLRFEEGTTDTVPYADQATAFLREYEEARGAPLGENQRRSTYGAALWLVAYVARCEHAFDVTGTAPSTDVGRLHLRADGETLLAMATG